MADSYAHAARILALGVVFSVPSGSGLDTDSEHTFAPVVITLTVPSGDSLQLGESPALAISRTGGLLVYAGRHRNVTRLYLQAVSGGEARALAWTEGAANPFFSPDGHWLGFFADGKLKKLSLQDANSTPSVICDASGPRGASWGEDGRIVFAIESRPELLRVSADGGEAQPLTKPTDQKDFGHRWPQVLPGGKAVLFAIDTGVGFDHARLAALSLETGEIRPLIAGGHSPSYVAGHLVFARDYTLFAARFDLATLAVTGPALPAMTNVSLHAFSGVAHFSVANNGVLAYISRDAPEAQRSLVWVDRTGTAKAVTPVKHAYDGPRLSPDGAKLAFVRTETPNDEVWTYDLKADRFTRLSDPSIDAGTPTWRPDSRHVTFSIKTSSGFNMFQASADGRGPQKRLLASRFFDFPDSWSPDGRTLAFSRYDPPTGWDIWMLAHGRDARPWIRTPGYRGGTRFSPDGRSVAYAFSESGRSEVYVQPYPGASNRRRVSSAGGRSPVWSPDGRELFYLEGHKLMSVRVRATSTSSDGPATALFDGPFTSGDATSTNYDVAHDGKSFVMVRSEVEAAHMTIRVVPSWPQQLPK